jgi:hypothetical protein
MPAMFLAAACCAPTSEQCVCSNIMPANHLSTADQTIPNRRQSQFVSFYEGENPHEYQPNR